MRAGAAGATFGSPTAYDAGSGAAVHLADGDFDHNGAADVVVGRLTPSGGYNPPPAVLPGGVSGPTLGAPVPIGAAPFDAGAAVETADVNRDGRDDVVVGSGNLNGLVSLLGTDTLAFTARGGAYIFPRQFAAWTLGDADKTTASWTSSPCSGSAPSRRSTSTTAVARCCGPAPRSWTSGPSPSGPRARR